MVPERKARDGRAADPSKLPAAAELEPGDRDDAFVPPYRSSWMDALDRWASRLPAGPWSFQITVLLLVGLASNAELWLTGSAVGTLDLEHSLRAVYLVYLLYLDHALDGVARSALAQFRPALQASNAEFARLRHELTVVPALPAAVIALLAIGAVLASGSAPAAATGGSLPMPVGAISAIGRLAFVALFVVLCLKIFRQLRLVSDLHRRVQTVDVLQPAPLYAFSRLTARTGIGLLVIPAFIVITAPQAETRALNVIIFMLFTIALAATCFVLPLVGMHDRIAAEKSRLQSAGNRRLAAALEDVHFAIDRHDRSDADGINKLLASVVVEREVLAKIRTWPWEAGTLRAFATAVLLPIGLWLLTRLLERVV